MWTGLGKNPVLRVRGRRLTPQALARTFQSWMFKNFQFWPNVKYLCGLNDSDTLALPLLLHGSETLTIKARDARRITAAEMKYMRRTAGYTWTDYKTNTQITKELKITPILDKLLEDKRNWIQHVNRMPHNRLPRVMKHYSPAGRRNHGRPLKRLLDTWDWNGLTSGPTPWQIYDDDVFALLMVFTDYIIKLQMSDEIRPCF